LPSRKPCLIEDEAYGRAQLLKFLRTAEPRHRRVLHELTTDAASLAGTLERFLPGRPLSTAAIRPEPTARFERVNALVDGAKSRERVLQTAAAAAALGRYLARIPGRKNLIWVSSTFPGSLVARVREDEVAIYPIDIRGIKAPDPGLVPEGPAAQTGGIAFYGSNDLREALQQAQEDSRATYLLGYYPSHGTGGR
jgi:VWFA-related protein